MKWSNEIPAWNEMTEIIKSLPGMK